MERAPGGPSPAPVLRAVTVESVRRGAEEAGATVTLSVVEDMGEGAPLSLLGRWGRRVLYASPAYVRLVDAASEEVAIRGMNAAIVANTAIRSSLVGFLKLLMVGGDVAPALLRNVYYHPDRRAEMVFMWLIPVLLVEEGDVRRCLDQGRTLAECCGPRKPMLGFVSYTDKASSLAREAESGLREHMCLKYTPTPVTMVDGAGFVVMQNAASITNIGIQGSEGRTAGSCRLNYLQELFVSDPTANDDMRAVTSTGRTWSRRLRVSESPLLRAWMQMGPAEERWHEVAVSRFRDPAYRAPTTAYIVAETDVTATVLAKRQVLALQRQQQALLREILPQQVIDVLLCHSEPPDDSRSPFCSDEDAPQAGLAAGGCATSRLQLALRRSGGGDWPKGSPAATVHGCSGPGLVITEGRPHQQTALARSRTEPTACLGTLAAAGSGLGLGGRNTRPAGWGVPDAPPDEGPFPPYAASVESSSLSSSVVSSYVTASLTAGRTSGANRVLAAATAPGAALPAADSQRPGPLQGCASAEGTPPPPAARRGSSSGGSRKPPFPWPLPPPPPAAADSMSTLSPEPEPEPEPAAQGPGQVPGPARLAPVTEQLLQQQPALSQPPAARAHSAAHTLAEWLQTTGADLPHVGPAETSVDCSDDSPARPVGSRAPAAGSALQPRQPQRSAHPGLGAARDAVEVEVGDVLQLLLLRGEETRHARDAVLSGAAVGLAGLGVGQRGIIAEPVDGSPGLGDSDADARSGCAAGEEPGPQGRPLRGTSSAGYSDCGGRRLSRRDVMALATWHESVTVVFADIVGFTAMCQRLHPARVMAFLDDLYNAFDHLLDETGCYKVETIGDCYMVCSGLFGRPPSPRPSGRPAAAAATRGDPLAGGGGGPGAWGGGAAPAEQAPPPPQLGGFDPEHASRALQFAKRLVQVALSVQSPVGAPVQMRVGLHSGAVVSGVVGRRMPRFCLFGDTVNTASRMESTGAPGRIHASEATRGLLLGERWEPRGTGIDIKGRGRMQTYWLGDGLARAGDHSDSVNLPSHSSGAIAAGAAALEASRR
ncbi:hypothetical protein HXX76_012525 [Chlamydomonas incerta]|uniref:Guanylate cyclase domain-containing protein n=1 Tax=Chlamydomonas incerta TaxID=51695 RepID=A0A835VTL0_CHLIN|nr:hypothetical protein HXX76_012525 [Chlamydomonas incerta]|eukprot:KAG2427330.1 hypothetical protein HXX76_012525 [Chlamydomonas incerta]